MDRVEKHHVPHYEALEAVGIDFFCPICVRLLNNPVLTPCGHSFCSECIGSWDPKPCPSCRSTVPQSFPNTEKQRAIQNLTVLCPNGCNLQLKVHQLYEHVSTLCPLEKLQCSNGCEEVHSRKDLQSHLEECSFRVVPCQYCIEAVPLNLHEAHFASCSEFPVPCPNNCGSTVPRSKMEGHVQGDCPLQPLTCEICSETVLRKSLPSHMENKQHHIEFLSKKSSRLESMVESLLQLNKATTKQNESLVDEMRMLHIDSQKQISLLRTKVQEMTTLNESLVQEIDQLRTSVFQSLAFPENQFVWKLKYSDLMSLNAVYSPRFCLKGYFFSFNAVLSTNHMELYFQLEKGPFDESLSWPFKGQYAFQIVNPTKDGDHYSLNRLEVVDTMTCGGKNNWSKPVSGRNKGLGWEFVSKEILRNYIVDDTIIIKGLVTLNEC